MANIFRTDVDPDALLHLLQNILDSLSDELKVVIGLSGGSLIHEFCGIFEKINFDWARAVFIFADERKVPFNDEESTFGQYQKHFVSKFPDRINSDQFLIIDPSLNVEDCASNYEWLLKKCDAIKISDDGFPIIDLLLLGIGPDGHTCSLFPDHIALKEVLSGVSSLPAAQVNPKNGRVCWVLDAGSATLIS
uniref:Glucosamine/galactosamine-6-phosphate isomerase domain-containing protein n=1 Tax=Romanomermis culicivorax TaxID=13658 RepID=A0A915IYF6_ROMCU